MSSQTFLCNTVTVNSPSVDKGPDTILGSKESDKIEPQKAPFDINFDEKQKEFVNALRLMDAGLLTPNGVYDLINTKSADALQSVINQVSNVKEDLPNTTCTDTVTESDVLQQLPQPSQPVPYISLYHVYSNTPPSITIIFLLFTLFMHRVYGIDFITFIIISVLVSYTWYNYGSESLKYAHLLWTPSPEQLYNHTVSALPVVQQVQSTPIENNTISKINSTNNAQYDSSKVKSELSPLTDSRVNLAKEDAHFHKRNYQILDMRTPTESKAQNFSKSA